MENSRLNQLESEIQSIKQRLLRLESNLRLAQLPEQPSVAPTSKVEFQPPPAAVIPSHEYIERDLPTKSSSSRGGSWLASVGVLFFLLAASSFIKLALDSGWLTPQRQLAGLILFGAALIGVGAQLKQRDRTYANFLPGCGVVILFMTAYAGHLYFELYSSLVATIAVVALSGLSIFLFHYFKHDIFLIVAALGCYFLPAILEQAHTAPLELRGYFILWDLLFSWCALALGRRLLVGLSAYLGIGLWHLIFIAQGPVSSQLAAAATFQILQFLVFSIAVAYFSIKHKQPLGGFEAWSLFPVLLLFYASEYALFSRIAPGLAPWIGLGFSLIVYAIYFFSKRHLNAESLPSSPVVATFIAFTIAHSFYLELLPDRFTPWFALLFTTAMALGTRSGFTYKRFWPAFYISFGIALHEYFKVLGTDARFSVLELILANFAFFTLLFLVSRKGGFSPKSTWFFLVIASIQALAGLEKVSFQISSGANAEFLVSGLWSAYALTLLTVAQRVRDRELARVSMAVFGVVAYKVLFFDLENSASIARIVALVVIGGLLYYGGLLWRRVADWRGTQSI